MAIYVICDPVTDGYEMKIIEIVNPESQVAFEFGVKWHALWLFGCIIFLL